MKKIVFFDIDGTLLDHEKKLPNSTKEAIRLLKENGVFTAIATGRAPFMFEGLRKELEIDSYVSFNGQFVVFENQVIFENPLQEEDLKRFLSETKKNNHPLIFMNDQTMKASVNYHSFIETSMGSLKFPHPDHDVNFFMNRNIYQSLLFCQEQEEKIYFNDFPNFNFIRWHPYSVDILPQGGSKTAGIKKMIERLGFDLEDVFAFGDGLNDLEMLQAVGTGVAMGNSVPEAKEEADLITTDVSEDGIWNGLKELQLI
ncbi:Cof-type HAD-IIB family hydrolase [Neobacillus massiliamazoniensis]|uniref:Cof family hydrolase n=1 Tax=Neobacillus massiliamazoniensis TaxID=1499688 RepID=A0A0U1NRH9_9BACI|nr:Cof-type HAD-IIB family hydrolase [Neobacillus massiliamazoniensis]CRK80650.1 cof family hydrolase [Neobacillus massiliamazoniensis]